jgi:hypothetical protein
MIDRCKLCNSWAIKQKGIKHWQQCGVFDDQMALKLRGSVVAPALQLCFHHALNHFPEARKRYQAQLPKWERNVSGLWGMQGRSYYTAEFPPPQIWLIPKQCRAKSKRTGQRCRDKAMSNGLCMRHGGITKFNCEAHRARRGNAERKRQRAWARLSRDPASPHLSPLEERFAAPRKPLKPLY